MQIASATSIATRAPIPETTSGECSPPGQGLDKNLREIFNKPEGPAKIAQDFATRTEHLKPTDGQQLRLKGDRIKLAQYVGLNPIKHALQAIGARSRAYNKQMDSLRIAFGLPKHISLERNTVATHLDNKLKLSILREDLYALQTEARKFASSYPDLTALLKEVDDRIAALNCQLDDLPHGATVQFDEISATIDTTTQFYNYLDALSDQILSKQREIHELSGALLSAPDYPAELDAFFAIWLTDSGRTAMEASLKSKSDVAIDAAKVRQELARLRQDANEDVTLFSTQQSDLEDAAAILSTYKAVHDQFAMMDFDTLDRYVDHPDLEPLRQVSYVALNEDFTSQERLLSKAANKEMVEYLGQLRTHDDLAGLDSQQGNTIYEIHGITMKKVYSKLLPATIEYTSMNVFSHMATFTVEHAERQDNGKLKVRLVENF